MVTLVGIWILLWEKLSNLWKPLEDNAFKAFKGKNYWNGKMKGQEKLCEEFWILKSLILFPQIYLCCVKKFDKWTLIYVILH